MQMHELCIFAIMQAKGNKFNMFIRVANNPVDLCNPGASIYIHSSSYPVKAAKSTLIYY